MQKKCFQGFSKYPIHTLMMRKQHTLDDVLPPNPKIFKMHSRLKFAKKSAKKIREITETKSAI